MKKIIFLIIILLFPIISYAKTPNQEEIITTINNINNIQVDDNIKIINMTVNDNIITINIEKDGSIETKTLECLWKEKELEFSGGNTLVNLDNYKIEEIKNNEVAFYLYSILESLSKVPYNSTQYYNNDTIKNIIESDQTLFQEEKKEYKDESNTFGISLSLENINSQTKKINISYHYYYDGDYPILTKNKDNNNEDNITNPSTRNYNIFVTILLIITIGIVILTYFYKPKNNKGDFND